MTSNAYFDFVSERDLFALRWKVLAAEGFDALTRELHSARERAGAPLFYVAIVKAGLPPFDDHAREAAMRSLDETYELMLTVRVVLVGEGFRLTMLRAATVGLTLVAGLSGRTFHVDKTLWDCAAHFEAQLGRPARDFIELVRANGLATPAELGEAPS